MERAAAAGNDVQLTIDLRLQHLAHRELKQAIAKSGAVSGSIVMLDAATGEILAMANQPSYNPNNRRGVKASQLRNRAVTDLFEPGSTMKPFTVASALESGRYRPDTVIDTSPGWYYIAGKTYEDKHNLGPIDLTTAIQKSSQVAISKLAQDLDPDAVRGMFARVGLGQPTGIGFPGEAAGQLPQHRRWHPTERAAQAFGHGISVTTLQLAQAYTAFAGGGQLHPATLLLSRELPAPYAAMPAEVADQVREMLVAVTDKGGTATRARTDHYTVAGKTGTAHKVGRGGYQADKYVAFFAGLAPAVDPKIVVAVVVNEPPADDYYGGLVAAPIFSSVVEGALRLLNVVPDRPALAAAQ